MSVQLRRSDQLVIRDDVKLSQPEDPRLPRRVLHRRKEVDRQVRRAEEETPRERIPQHLRHSGTTHEVCYLNI